MAQCHYCSCGGRSSPPLDKHRSTSSPSYKQTSRSHLDGARAPAVAKHTRIERSSTGRRRRSPMASVVFETTKDAAVASGGDDVVFCVVILCLSVLSMVIFAASSSASSDGEGKRRRRSGSRANGPVFVGGWGCGCGGCRTGAGVCGTYLS